MERKEHLVETENALDALAAVRSSEATFASKARWPLWRHAAYGLLMAMGVIAIGVPQELTPVIIVAFGLSFWLLISNDRKRDGFFVNGYSSKRAAPAIILAAVFAGSGMIALILADAVFRWSLISLAVAAIVFVGCTLASVWWEKLYQSELREAAKS